MAAYTTMANHTRAAELAMQKAYGPISMLPPTDNKPLLSSTMALNNPTVFLVSSALFQHTATLAFIFLLRGFSTKRVFDIHFLTVVFAVTMILVPLVFLLYTELSRTKLLFFLEHEAIEVLIAARVLLPTELIARRPGLIILVLYSVLFAMSLPLVMHDFFSHGALFVAWGAFCSDFLLATSGVTMIKRWLTIRREGSSRAVIQKHQAEALAGLGFILHGCPTMSIGPIFTLVIYNGLDPNWFAYAWVGVSISAFFVIAFAVPSAALFFSNTWWCCGSRRPTYPGDVDWEEERIQEKPRHRISSPMFRPPGASGSSVDGYQVETVPISVQRVRSGVEWEMLAKAY